MSETDAARFHKVSLRSIQNFIRGRRSAPEGVFTEIGDLVRRMHHAADALSRTLTPETEGTLQFSTADNAAAQALGWPCAATYAAVVGMALASAPRPFLQAALDSSTFGG